MFLVRKSRKGSDTQPYTLVILYEGHFFNLKIRCRPEDQKIALGEEKRGEMVSKQLLPFRALPKAAASCIHLVSKGLYWLNTVFASAVNRLKAYQHS